MPTVTFDGVSSTLTAANGIANDAQPPNFGAIDPKSMHTSNSALPGPEPGTDVKLIHGGDYVEQIEKNRRGTVLENDVQTVTLVMKETVYGEVVLQFKGGRTLNITPFDHTEVHGERKMKVTAEDTEEYGVHREIHEPLKFETNWIGELGFKGFVIDTQALNVEAKATSIGIEGLRIFVAPFKDTNDIIATEVRALHPDFLALDTRLGCFVLDMIPRINATLGIPNV